MTQTIRDLVTEGMLKYWWEIYQHSKLIGRGMDLFRNIEDSYLLRSVNGLLRPGDAYLDVGCGTSAMPTLICKKFGCRTFAIDLDPNALQVQRTYASKLGLPNKEFITSLQDARNLAYPDSYFSVVSAVSSIEHIPELGDIHAMNEIHRVLRLEGRVVIMVPFADVYVENPCTFYHSGFERRYDYESFDERIVGDRFVVLDRLFLYLRHDEKSRRLQLEMSGFLGEEGLHEAWYKTGFSTKFQELSILFTLNLIELSDSLLTGVIGCCALLGKRETSNTVVANTFISL